MCIAQIFFWFPCVLEAAVALPSNKELLLATHQAAGQHRFHLILRLIVLQQHRSPLAGRALHRFQLGAVEHRVDPHRGRQQQSPGLGRHLLHHSEGTGEALRQLAGALAQWEVGGSKPHLTPHGDGGVAPVLVSLRLHAARSSFL